LKVKELIEALKTLDQDLPIVIADADEGGTPLNIKDITDEGDYISLGGYYYDIWEKQ
jgi:hypothetical protein